MASHTIKARRWAIERLKDENGIRTDEDLAARIGVSPKTVQRAKAGEAVNARLIAGLWSAFGKAAGNEVLYLDEDQPAAREAATVAGYAQHFSTAATK